MTDGDHEPAEQDSLFKLRARQMRAEERSPIEVARLNAFSDGVFAIAATLLVLELHVPELAHGLSMAAQEHQMAQRLLALAPQLGAFLLSFWVIGREWVLHSRYTYPLRQATAQIGMRNLWFLITISLLPFTAALLGQQGNLRVVWWVYISNLILMELSLLWLLSALEHNSDVQSRSPQAWQAETRRAVAVLLVFVLSALLTFLNVVVAQLSLLLMIIANALIERLYRGRTTPHRD